jgi:hypothetical protein
MSGFTRASRNRDQVAEAATKRVGRAVPSRHSQVASFLTLQRLAGNRAVDPLLHSGLERVGDNGQPLEPATRVSMEERFGEDFSKVRVHSDTAARDAAQALGANAFTFRQHVFLGSGGKDLGSAAGRKVLAHELAHVVQQRDEGGRSPMQGRPGDQFEQEADAAAQGAEGGQRISVEPRAGVPILQLQQRQGATATPEQIEAELRRQYIVLAEEHIAGIDDALVSGYIWWFEEKFFSGRTEDETTTLEQRNAALRSLAGHLREFIDGLHAGGRYWSLRPEWIDLRLRSGASGKETVSSGELSLALGEFLKETQGVDLRVPLEFSAGGATLGTYLFFGPKKTPVLPSASPSGAAVVATPPGSPVPKKAAPATASRPAKPATSPAAKDKIASKKPTAPTPAPSNQTAVPPTETPSQELAREPQPSQSAASPPSRRQFPETEATGWHVEILDPEQRPQEVEGLLTPREASYARAGPQGRIIRTYKPTLFRETGTSQRFYYFYKGQKVYLPNLLDAHPEAAIPPATSATP